MGGERRHAPQSRQRSRAVANAPVQRSRGDAETYVERNGLALDVSWRSVRAYVSDPEKPRVHRQGLLAAWNRDQSPRWAIRDDLVDEDEPRRYGIGTYNINHLGKGKASTERKIEEVGGLMQDNPWLELLSLQEVNDPKALDDLDDEVEVLSQGPLMRSINVKGSKSTREVYPLLARKGSGWAVNRVETFFPGDEEPEEWDEDAGALVWRDRTTQGKTEEKIFRGLGRRIPRGTKNRDKWFSDQEARVRKGRAKNKKALLALFKERSSDKETQDERTRPVVIYRLENDDGRQLNVGVVHTTPSGKEFGRRDVYGQLEDFFAYADEQAGSGEEGSEDWVILGDYYLADEAELDTLSNRKTRKREKTFGQRFHQADRPPFSFDREPDFPNLELATTVSATNWPVTHQPPKKRKGSKKPKEGRIDKAQIADFMITSKNLGKRAVGSFDPWMGGIWPFDPGHRVLKEWMEVSDHVPVGGLLSTAEERDPEVSKLFFQAEKQAFPPSMRSLEALDDPKSLEELQEIQKGKKTALRKRKRSEIDLEEEDAFFFLDQDEVPEGAFSYFTHDLPGVQTALRSLLSRKEVDKLDPALWFGDGTAAGFLASARTVLSSRRYQKLRSELQGILDDNLRD